MEEDIVTKIDERRVRYEYWIDRRGISHRFEGDMNKECTSLHSGIASHLHPQVKDAVAVLDRKGWIRFS